MPEQESPILPDALLLERLVQRDSTALIELERRHLSSLYAQVYGMVVDASLAERVVRETFAHLWYAAARFVGTRSALSWLRDTARELARAELALRDRMGTTSDWRRYEEEDSAVRSGDAAAGVARRASARAERSRVGYSEGESSGSEGPPRDARAW
jgi:DNA-directed RNA polymerase specialized sigma24 family protein